MEKLWKYFVYSFAYNYDRERIFKILVSFFGIIGFLWTLIECFSWIFDKSTYPDTLRMFIRGYIIIETCLIAIVSLIINRKRTKIQRAFSKSDLTVMVEFCDIFKQSGAIIIPVMDTFDNDTTNGLVNPRTIHGQFIRNYFDNNVQTLDNQISTALANVGNKPMDTNPKLKGKKDRYEIGTSCPIKTHNKYFYLSALTYMQETGNVDMQPQYIYDFLSNLWNFIPNHGEYHDIINIPVIATGLHRLPASYTNQFILGEIVNSFFTTSKQQTFCKTLRICLHISDFNRYNFSDIEILLAHIETYLNR